MWAMIKRETILMHWAKTTFIYHSDFNKCMKVQGAMLEDAFYYLFDIGVEKFVLEKRK